MFSFLPACVHLNDTYMFYLTSPLQSYRALVSPSLFRQTPLYYTMNLPFPPPFTLPRSILCLVHRVIRRAQHVMGHPDFGEGVRALLVDKDNKPEWVPTTLEGVSESALEAFFAPIGDGELVI